MFEYPFWTKNSIVSESAEAHNRMFETNVPTFSVALKR